MLTINASISITNRKLKTILNDAEKSARSVNLVYVNDTLEGISRIKKGNNFIYRQGKRLIKDAENLARIRHLVIPPAWENVWICPFENGHLQVTGTDLKKRKQYKYHNLWNSLRNQTKFYRLHSLGTAMPAIRQQLQHDLSLPGLPQEKVLAAVVRLMECTSIRIGNSMYEKLYGSFGLTTLKDRHVKINGGTRQFSFKGKKGIMHTISLKSKSLATIVKKCKDIPGKELFQYYDEKGTRHCVDSGMVNAYIKKISGQDFSAKDFRTWAGSVQALIAFKEIGACENITGIKKNIVSALDLVSKHLGNTRAVCKKYYVHPVILSLYESKTLHSVYLKNITKNNTDISELTDEEKLLLKILEKESLTIQ